MSMHHNICYQAKEPELEHKIYSTVLHCTCALVLWGSQPQVSFDKCIFTCTQLKL